MSVLYPPDAPQKAQVEGFMELWMLPFITGIIGLAMTAAAVLTWVFRDALYKLYR